MTFYISLKNRVFRAFCITFSAFILLFFVSCESEATITARKDGSVQIEFTGACGTYFENMMRSFSGEDESAPLFDAAELKQNFIESGFSNVFVSTPANASVFAKFTDNGNSFLFTSGLLSSNKTNITVKLSPEILQKFYDASDDQTKTILDLFIAPVFNNEEMSEEEYLEVIGSFYGNEAISEVNEGKIKLTLISADGKKREFKLSLIELLTLNKAITFD